MLLRCLRYNIDCDVKTLNDCAYVNKFLELQELQLTNFDTLNLLSGNLINIMRQ